MKFAFALLATSLLAGCSAFGPPDAAPANASEGGLPIPTLTPRIPEGCGSVEIDSGNDHHVTPGLAMVFHVTIRPRCGNFPMQLAYGGLCPREFLTVTLDGKWLLDENSAYLWDGTCPPERARPAEPPSLPFGYEITRRFTWNGTLAQPCGEGCWESTAAPDGEHIIAATAYGPGDEIWSAQIRVTVAPYCVDLVPVAPEPGSYDTTLLLNGAVVLNATWNALSGGDAVVSARWCGVPGMHELTWKEASRPLNETALVEITGATARIRPGPPLTVENLGAR